MNLTQTLVLTLLLFTTASFGSEPIKSNHSTTNNVGVLTVDKEDFQALADRRKRLIISQKSMEDEIRRLEQQKGYLPESPESIDQSINMINARMLTESKRIEQLKSILERTIEQETELQQLVDYTNADKLQIERLQDDKKRLIALNTETNQLNRQNNASYVELASIEQRIANLLNLEDERNAFRTWVSIAFCVLVAIVIIGFYSIAMKKEAIAESIFAGEKGIQFVTIFLIVIAIILFGIMGILEGKELSALLGGLSGYILGRVSGTHQDSKCCPAANASSDASQGNNN